MGAGCMKCLTNKEICHRMLTQWLQWLRLTQKILKLQLFAGQLGIKRRHHLQKRTSRRKKILQNKTVGKQMRARQLMAALLWKVLQTTMVTVQHLWMGWKSKKLVPRYKWKPEQDKELNCSPFWLLVG